MAVAGLTLIILSAGIVVVLGHAIRDPVRSSLEQLSTFYEEEDADGVMERLAPGSVGSDPEDMQAVRASLRQILQEDFKPVHTRSITVRGVRLVQIETEGLEWCMLPRDLIALTCRVGLVEFSVDVSDSELSRAEATLDLYPDRLELATVLVNDDESQVQVDRGISATKLGQSMALEMVEASYLSEIGRVPASDGPLTVREDTPLVLIFEATQLEAVDEFATGSWELMWEEGLLVIEPSSTEWHLSPD